VSAANASVISTLRAGCHFYLAPTPLLRAIPRDACRDEGRPNNVDHASGGSNKGLSKELAK